MAVQTNRREEERARGDGWGQREREAEVERPTDTESMGQWGAEERDGARVPGK